MEERDYSHLIGKEVKVHNYFEGVVAHIDPECGITIVSKHNPKQRLVCLMHPDIFEAKHRFRPNASEELYKALFQSYVLGIETGKWGDFCDERAYAEVGRENPDTSLPEGPPADACAFS